MSTMMGNNGVADALTAPPLLRNNHDYTASIASLTALQKQLRSTTFPPNFSEKCNIGRVHRTVIVHWIKQRIESILGFNDNIVSSTAVHLFLPEPQDGGANPDVDPRRAQLDLKGFLGGWEAASFASKLWTMMLNAQDLPSSIPKVLVEKKKEEMRRQREGGGSGGEMNAFVREAAHRVEAARAIILADGPNRPPTPAVPTAAAAAAAASSSSAGVAADGAGVGGAGQAAIHAANPPPVVVAAGG